MKRSLENGKDPNEVKGMKVFFSYRIQSFLEYLNFLQF